MTVGSPILPLVVAMEEKHLMRSSALTGYILVALCALLPASTHPTCGEECDTAYSCVQFGDDPADADDLAACIRAGRDDEWSGLDDWAGAAISLPSPRRAAKHTLPLLCVRYRKLARSGKPANVVTAAIARELAGFVWAIARRVPPAAG